MTSRRSRLIIAGALVCAASLLPSNGIAACTSPTANAGSMNWNGTAMQVCDGSSWSNLGGGGTLATLSDVALNSPASGNVLQFNGVDWINVAATNAMATATMVANWPDAMRCSFSSPSGYNFKILLLDQAPAAAGYYDYSAFNAGGLHFIVRFNADGTYSGTHHYNGASWVTGISSCDGQPITNQYAAGRAFNFIGTGAVTTFDVGTAAAPGLAVTGDTNTGLWSSGADTLNISTGGIERIRVTASGNVGIGTTSPALKLHVVGGGLYSTDNSVNTIFRSHPSIAGGEVGTIDAAPLWFATTGAERMRITSGGNVGIGTYNPSQRLEVYQGNIHIQNAGSETGSFIDNFISSAGTNSSLCYSGSGAFGACSSDARLKANISYATEGMLSNVMRLKPARFDFSAIDGAKHQLGFIAQDVKQVLPEAVGTDTAGYYTLTTNALIAALVGAVQELKLSNDELRRQFYAYKAAHP